MGELLRGDCLEQLEVLPDNSVDCVITDPPYGLRELPPASVADALRHWLDGESTFPFRQSRWVMA